MNWFANLVRRALGRDSASANAMTVEASGTQTNGRSMRSTHALAPKDSIHPSPRSNLAAFGQKVATDTPGLDEWIRAFDLDKAA